MMGRTETVRYSSRYGDVSFQPSALKWMIYVDKGDDYQSFVDCTVAFYVSFMLIITTALIEGGQGRGLTLFERR